MKTPDVYVKSENDSPYYICLDVCMKPLSKASDLAANLDALLVLDPKLIPIAETSGPLPLRQRDPGFLSLANIVIGQLVSRAAAEAIYARFIEEINPATPQQYLNAGEEVLIRIGLSGAKRNTIAGIAQAILDETLNINALSTLPQSEAIKQMTALKGIGQWTAEVYLLFCANHPDIFPAGDLALREAVRHAFRLEERPDEKSLREIAKQWKPLRGIAAQLFWSYYKQIKGGRESQPL